MCKIPKPTPTWTARWSARLHLLATCIWPDCCARHESLQLLYVGVEHLISGVMYLSCLSVCCSHQHVFEPETIHSLQPYHAFSYARAETQAFNWKPSQFILHVPLANFFPGGPCLRAMETINPQTKDRLLLLSFARLGSLMRETNPKPQP